MTVEVFQPIETYWPGEEFVVKQFAMDDLDWINYTFDLFEPYCGGDSEFFFEKAKVMPSQMMFGGANPYIVKGETQKRTFNEIEVLPPMPENQQRQLELLKLPQEINNNNNKVEEEEQVQETPLPPKKKKRARFSKDNLEYVQGRWKPDELSLLLHIAREYVSEDLKVIGDISFFAGIHRPRRAIDKQLKRMLKYDRWINRNPIELKKQITHLLQHQYQTPLSPFQIAKLEQAKEMW